MMSYYDSDEDYYYSSRPRAQSPGTGRYTSVPDTSQTTGGWFYPSNAPPYQDDEGAQHMHPEFADVGPQVCVESLEDEVQRLRDTIQTLKSKLFRRPARAADRGGDLRARGSSTSASSSAISRMPARIWRRPSRSSSMLAGADRARLSEARTVREKAQALDDMRQHQKREDMRVLKQREKAANQRAEAAERARKAAEQEAAELRAHQTRRGRCRHGQLPARRHGQCHQLEALGGATGSRAPPRQCHQLGARRHGEAEAAGPEVRRGPEVSHRLQVEGRRPEVSRRPEVEGLEGAAAAAAEVSTLFEIRTSGEESKQTAQLPKPTPKKRKPVVPKVASRLSEDQKKLAKSLPNNRILFFFPSSDGDDEFVQFISNNGILAPKWWRAKALVVEQLKGKTPLAKEDSELLTRAENSILVKGVLDYIEAVYNLQDCKTRMKESQTSLSVFMSHINFLFARLDAVRTRISPESKVDWNVVEKKNITFVSANIVSRPDKEIFTQMLCDGKDPQEVKEAIEKFLKLLDQIPVEDCDLPYKSDTTFKFDDDEDRQVMYTWWEKTLNRKKQDLNAQESRPIRITH